jgi:hypothetical protein
MPDWLKFNFVRTQPRESPEWQYFFAVKIFPQLKNTTFAAPHPPINISTKQHLKNDLPN